MPIGKLVNTIADFETSLASKVIVGATTATLTSATDSDGVALPSGTYGFTIDRKNSSKEYFTADLAGTALTNVKSVKRGDGSETTGFAIEHRQGSEVIISDYVAIKRIQDILVTGYATDPSPMTDFQLATKKYVDDTSFGGVSVVDKVVIVAMAGETIAAGNVVYLKGADSRWWLADARTSTTSENVVLGIAQGAATAGDNITGGVLVAGLDQNQTGLTANTVYYVSDTPGALSSTAGTKEVTVGLATATTKIMFSPSYNQQITEDEQDALVGSQGIPNVNNKYVTQDNIYTSETDQTQTTQNDVTGVGEADAITKYNKLYQSFIPSKTKIRGVKLYKGADTGTFTGTVTVALKADSGGSPTGSALATVTISNESWLLISTGEFEAIFSSEYSSMTVGSLYWIEISCSTADNSNHPNLGHNTTGGYSSGSVKFWNTTDSYTAVATIDLYFKTLQGVSSQLSYISSEPSVTVLTNNSVSRGSATTRFDITHPSGTTYRYTWDGTGTDPQINTTNFAVGYRVVIYFSGISQIGNFGEFEITASGTNYFEVTNASGQAVNDVVLGTTGYLKVIPYQVYTPSVGVKYSKIRLVGGGGGGGYNATLGSGGGGGGGYSEKIISVSSLLSLQRCYVGIGGQTFSGGFYYVTSTPGSSSRFGSIMYATGGGGGGVYNSYAGGSGGTGSGGTINITGQGGGGGTALTSVKISGTGGSSVLGGGAYGNYNSNGITGGSYGGGGSGGLSSGGTGGTGVIIIEEYFY